MRNITFHILCGLPGSGKSFYREQMMWKSFDTRTSTDNVEINLDDYKQETIEESINYAFNGLNNLNRYLSDDYREYNLCAYIDGVISYSKENFKRVLDAIIKNTLELTNERHIKVDVILHQWEADREKCLHNDKMRVYNGKREESSKLTIQNIQYEIAKESDLLDIACEYPVINSISLEKHEIKLLTTYDILIYPHTGYEKYNKRSKYMYSDAWSTGGNWCDCWGNDCPISGEKPVEFYQFTELLEKIAPNISFLQYKKIDKECISVDEYGEPDYYGGCEYKARYQCDMPKLYSMLLEMGYIKEFNYEGNDRSKD